MKVPDFRITSKTFILITFFILLIPLFFAAQSLFSGGGQTTLDVTVNQSSDWSSLQFDGGRIAGIGILSSPGHVGFTGNTLRVNGTGITKVTVTLADIQDTVKISLVKGSAGTAAATIAGVGTLDNTQAPLSIPITLATNSTSAAIRFSGMEIEDAKITSLSGAGQVPVIDKNVILIQNPQGQDVDLSLAALVSFSQDQPVITVEKGDTGIVHATVDHYEYQNNNQGQKTVSNLPVLIEMTSNTTQVFFNGASIVKGSPLNIDNNRLAENIVGDSFIYLKYDDTDNTFHHANYVLDLNVSDASTLTVYKNNDGFVHLSVGNNEYFVTGQSDSLSYVNTTLHMGIPQFTQTPVTSLKVSVPVSIDTTSDWTDVTFQGLDNLALTVTGREGNIAEPSVFGNTLSIRKTTLTDTTPAHVDLQLTATNPDNPKLLIEKGDLGYTTVNVGDNAVLSNSQKVNGNPRNGVTYDLPTLPLSPYQDITVQQNPVAYYFPADLVVAERGITLEDTRAKPATLLISKTGLPGFHPALPAPVAKGVIAFIGISMILIGIFGIALLRRDGFFSFLPRTKISTEFLWKLALGTLEKLEVSSVLIVEAILALAVTPFLLMTNETLAEGAAIVAYLLLVGGVVVRILEMKAMFTTEREKCMMLKLVSLVILLTAGYIAAFYLLPHLAGYIALVGTGIVTLFFLWVVYLYVNRDLYEFTP